MNSLTIIMFLVSFAAIYYVRMHLLNNMRTCTGPDNCLIATVTFMNITSLAILLMSLLFSGSCTGAFAGVAIGMFLNAQLLFVERAIRKHLN